jgi:hypothetical protein
MGKWFHIFRRDLQRTLPGADYKVGKVAGQNMQ